MNTNAHRRGSVLMELIVVMPIYIVLLAGTFMIGDSLLVGTGLAHSERRLAFRDLTGLETGIQGRRYHADTDVQGAWTVRCDVKETYAYSLPAYGIAGMLLFGDQVFGGQSADSAETSEVATGAHTGLGALIRGGTVNLYSKDNGSYRAFKFNVYMLRRNRDVLEGCSSWRDNARHPSQLLCNKDDDGVEVWERHVSSEFWHGTIDELAGGNVSKSFPANSGFSAHYSRYVGFKTFTGETSQEGD